MMYLIVLLALSTVFTTCSNFEEVATRSPHGENWKIISRGSIGTGAIGFTITNPGNYMLSESVTPASGNATAIIQINTDDVVLDLAGHSLNGSIITSTGKGIIINARKNVTIRNGHFTSVPNVNLHVVAGSSNIRLENLTITNPGSSNDIQLDAGNVKLSNITVIGGGSAGNSINIGNSLNDIIIDTARVSNISGRAINVGTSCYNIRIKNTELDTCLGTNNAIAIGASCYDVLIDNFRFSDITSDGISIGASCYGIIMRQGFLTNCSGAGVTVGASTAGIQLLGLSITGCATGILCSGTNGGVIGQCTVTKSTGTSCYSCKLTSSQNIIIEKCNFFGSTSTGNPVSGLWLTSCSNITCNGVQSGGHAGSQAFGFKLDTTCLGCSFNSCLSQGNIATSTTAGQGAYGFYFSTANGNTLTNCVAAGNQGGLQAFGFFSTGCSANTFVGCKALQSLVTTGSNAALAAGFYSVGGSANRWQECEAHGQNAGNIATSTGYGAVGFYLGNELQSSLYRCKAIGNGATATHAATSAGFYFDATLNSACKYLEIRECAANSNCTSATTGTTAYGFWDGATATSNVFIDCYSASNSDNANPRVVTNYYANLPVGGTTPSNFPRVEASIDGYLDIANKPLFYNVSITS